MPVRFYGSGVQSGLSAIAEGANQGIGLGLDIAQMRRQKARDEENDRRYEEQKKLAIEAADRAKSQEARDAEAFAINKAERDKLAQSTQDIATQAVTSGLKEGAMGPHSQEDEFALDVARRMSPEMLPKFMDELHREKRTKMLVDQRERHLSDLQSFASEPGAREFMTEDVQARLKGAFDDLTATEDPEQLAKLLPLTRATIDGTRELLAERSARKQEVEAVGTYWTQRLGEDMQAAMMERNPAIKAWKLQQIDQQRRYLGAFMTSKPGSIKTADFLARMSAMDNDFPASMLSQGGGGGAGAKPQGAQAGMKSYADALVLARKILGDSAKVTEEQLRGMANQLWESGVGDRFNAQMDAMPNPITGPTPGALDLPFAESRPGMEQAGGAQPQPEQQAPQQNGVPFPEANGRRKFVAAIVDDLAKNGGAGLEQLYTQFGIKVGTLDEETKREIKKRVEDVRMAPVNKRWAESQAKQRR